MSWECIEVAVIARPVLPVLIALTFGTTFGASAQEEGHERHLQYSLQVDVDEESRMQIAASETDLARGDVLTAVSRWRALLDGDRSRGLVPFRGAFVSTGTAIRATLRSLPGPVRDEALRIAEPIARRALAEAVKTDDHSASWSVVERFPGTDAAMDACRRLAERCFDSGRFAECGLAVDRWLDDSVDLNAAIAQQPQMVVWRRLSLLMLGEPAEAANGWNEHEVLIPPDLRQALANIEALRLLPLPNMEEVVQTPVRDVTDVLPSEEVIWSVPLASEHERAWTPLVHDFEELAQPLLMVGRPATVPGGFLVSGTGQRHIHPATGNLHWSAEFSPGGSGETRREALEGLRTALGESIAGRCAVVGERLFRFAAPRGEPGSAPFARQLEVISLTDHRTLRSPGPATYLGPPAAGHGQLYLLVQSEQQLTLTALELDSLEPRWECRLGDAGLSLTLDHRRRWMPAQLETSGDLVACATANGAVAAVDPRSGRLRWIARGERDDWRNAGPPQMSAVSSAPRFRMWTGWREPVLQSVGDVLIWAAPESNTLSGLDRRTGQRRWSQPRNNGLAVVVSGDVVLVISDEEIRRINPADGARIWSSRVAQPSGTGSVAGDWYVQPLRSGGTAAIRLDDGTVTRSVAWGAEVMNKPRSAMDQLRSLTWSPQGVLVQTPVSISLHRTVARVATESPERSATAEWLAAAGRLDDAMRVNAHPGRGAALEQMRLQFIARETAENQFHLAARPFERLPEVTNVPHSEEQVAAFLLDRRPETAITLLAGVSLEHLTTIWTESNRKPRVRIRADVLAAGTILEASAGQRTDPGVAISPAGRVGLDDLLKRVAVTRPGDVPGILSLLSRTDWGASKILDREMPTGVPTGDRHAVARLRLALRALESRGAEIAARAEQFGRALTPVMLPVTAWPATDPVLSQRQWKSLIGRWPAQFTPLDDSELKGLSIDLLLTGFHRRVQGRGVHFAGCGQDSPWEIDLPRTDRSLGQSSDDRRAVGIGPLVILQSSTGLHGILPLNSAGERGATRLWDVPWIDMWGQVASHSVTFLPRLSDATPGRHPPDVDEFGRPLTQFGPVTASYFCYREFGRLVCCDTVTGRRRWDRREFDPDAFVAGDETAVIVISPTQKRLEILDPVDGQLASSQTVDFSSRHWRAVIATTAFLRSGWQQDNAVPQRGPDERSEIVAIDLKTGQPKWKQDLDPAAIEFTVGQRLVGAVDAKGIRLFDLEDGAQKKHIAIDPPADFADVYAVDDPFAVMICVFGPPAVEQLRPPLQLLGNRRKPYANGLVYGLDPETLELKWTLQLDRSVFPLDQPRDIPLLVIHDAVTVPGGGEQELREDRIRCFDKRTGRQVADLNRELIGSTGIVIERSQPAGLVEVRTSRGVFRFEYPEATK